MRKLSNEEFISKAKQVHPGYGYGRCVYLGSGAKVEVLCEQHGAFWQLPGNHLQGAGCPKCSGRGVNWVDRFASVHGDLYDYSKVVVTGYKSPVIIGCPHHGEFLQTPDNHFRGKQGCPKCRGERIRRSKRMPVAEFVKKAIAVHGNRFIYVASQFNNVLSGDVKAYCVAHSTWFSQTPSNHLAGKIGCGRCSNQQSAAEREIAQFVSIFAPIVPRDRSILAPKELDVYIPSKNLAIEYCGMYWHSHFSAEDERANKHNHNVKYTRCADKGIRLITIYESEWQAHKPAIKRLLRNALGKSRGSLMARKCELKTVPTQDARAFYDKYHPQGGAGNGSHYGLYHGEKLVACMRFTYGANDRGSAVKNRAWTLTRYATRVTVAGGASRLLKAFLRDETPTEVKSFSDNRYFDGGMYKALGFELQGVSAPDYQVWSPKLGLRPKSHYQRRALPKRQADHGVAVNFNPSTDTRTESEVTYEMRCGRIYDCGKKKWLLRPTQK